MAKHDSSPKSVGWAVVMAVRLNPKLDILSPKTEAAYQRFIQRKTMSIHILVYGTLRKHASRNHNFGRMGEQRHVGDMQVPGYRMFSYGPYPFVVPDPDGVITCELHEVDHRTYDLITQMEVGAGYRVDEIHQVYRADGRPVSARIYVKDSDHFSTRSFPEVTSGDWAKG